MSDTPHPNDDNDPFFDKAAALERASTLPEHTGHPTGFWFFIWGEFAERCSYYGMRAILALYMTERLGVDKGDAGTYMSLFIAACYFLPLLGGIIADNFLGKYWTIVGFSIPYVVGQVLVGVEDKLFVMIALGLLAMGSGVIKPNISTLMGLTYDQQRPGLEQLRTSAFSWFYLAINVGAFLSQSTMPYLRQEYGYRVAFMFPAALMTIALIVFACGKKFYAKETIGAAAAEDDPDGPSKWAVLGKIGMLFGLVMIFWAIFDQSASTWIFFADTYMDCHMFGKVISADAIQSYNALFIMIFLPVSVLLFKTLAAVGYKIRATDKMMVGFILTASCMGVMSYAGFKAGKAEKAVKLTNPNGTIILANTKSEFSSLNGQLDVPFENGPTLSATDLKYNEKNKKVTFANGKLIFANGQTLDFSNGVLGDTSNSLLNADMSSQMKESEIKPTSDADVQAAIKKAADGATVTLENIDYVKPAERVTVWWQVFAYLVLTLAEILISVTGLELAFVVAPKSMKGLVTACWLLTVALANLLINAPITQLYPLMEPGVYFAMLAGAACVVTCLFFLVAMRFNR
ncbi:POT-type proton-dependent oligopeptide transporter [Zavarzinella formosa]|uniref:POT-type proton-dependent oligopeptide transporter n=1 Tax=Zavarzinella formosa TaxID=360055 RepID=UPI00031919D1|nr:MFS transporter [Zavarzinella formosa]